MHTQATHDWPVRRFSALGWPQVGKKSVTATSQLFVLDRFLDLAFWDANVFPPSFSGGGCVWKRSEGGKDGLEKGGGVTVYTQQLTENTHSRGAAFFSVIFLTPPFFLLEKVASFWVFRVCFYFCLRWISVFSWESCASFSKGEGERGLGFSGGYRVLWMYPDTSELVLEIDV